MKKIKGYIYINVLLIMSILIIIVFYILDNNSDLLLSFKNEEDLINSSYKSESLLNIGLKDMDKINEKLVDVYFKEVQYDLDYNKNLLKDLEKSSLVLKNDEDEKDYFNLVARIKYKGINNIAIAKGSIVNDIYTKEISVLNKNTLTNDELIDIKEDYKNLNTYFINKKREINLKEGTYYIKREKNKNIIYNYVNDIENTVKSFRQNDIVFITQKEGDFVVCENVNINGILSVDNLVLLDDLNLKGLFNVNNEIISSSNQIFVEGLVVNLDSFDESYINSKYNFLYIKDLGKNIPKFINAKVLSIKKG